MRDPLANQEVVAAVMRRHGRFLLAQRPAHKPKGGLWEFPGGKVEPAESLEAAIARELCEELSLQPAARPRRLLTLSEGHLQLHFMAVRATGTPDKRVHQAIAWCSLQQARRLPLCPLDRQFLNTLLARQLSG